MVARAAGQGIRVVIDACVADCSDPKPREARRSRSCRVFLEHIRSLKFAAAYTAELKKEWDQHSRASRFITLWRTQMKSRGRLVMAPPQTSLRAAVADACCDRRILQPSEIKEVVKDWPVVEAAVATDRRVASLDDAARARFSRLSARVDALRRVVWVNPEKTGESPIDWLQRGAPEQDSRTLEYWRQRSRRHKGR